MQASKQQPAAGQCPTSFPIYLVAQEGCWMKRLDRSKKKLARF